jgi:hypothetical protein
MYRSRTLLLTVVLLYAFVTAGGVTAQGATPVAATEHPIVGAWEVRTTSDQFPGLLFAIFMAEGVYLQVEYVPAGETRSPVGVGTWEATGERSADAMYWVLQDEDGTHVMIWLSLETSIGGGSMHGTISTLIMDSLGGISQQATANVSGIKLTAGPDLVGG